MALSPVPRPEIHGFRTATKDKYVDGLTTSLKPADFDDVERWQKLLVRIKKSKATDFDYATDLQAELEWTRRLPEPNSRLLQLVLFSRGETQKINLNRRFVLHPSGEMNEDLPPVLEERGVQKLGGYVVEVWLPRN